MNSAYGNRGEFLVRIDERLIHAQVLIGWVTTLNLKGLAIASATVARDPDSSELYRLIVPSGLELQIADEPGAAQWLRRDWRGARHEVMTLTATVAGALHLLTALGEDAPRRIHIGGLYHRPGREKLHDGLYLSAAEMQETRDLLAAGTEVVFMPLPGSKPLNLSEMLGNG